MAYQFECQHDGCEFMIRSNAGEEVSKLVRAHARVTHDGRFAPVDIERGIERIEAG